MIIENNSLEKSDLLANESLFTLGNGYFGVRGNFEEDYLGTAEPIKGCYINGVYSRFDIGYYDAPFGSPTLCDKQPRIFDVQTIKIYLDGEMASLHKNNHDEYKRSLNLETGVITRTFKYTTSKDKTATITYKRLVSFVVKELFLIDLTVEYDGEIKVDSYVDADVKNATDRSNSTSTTTLDNTSFYNLKNEFNDNIYFMSGLLKMSDIEVSALSHHKVYNIYEVEQTTRHIDSELTQVHTMKAKGSLKMSKLNLFTDSLRTPKGSHKIYLVEKLNTLLYNIDGIYKDQEEFLKKFWKLARLNFDLDEKNLLNYSTFQVLQSTGTDGFSTISEHGLSGEVNDGHYFTDIETYALPLITLMQPKVAKNLLMFRYNMLDYAKAEALKHNVKRGAKYPYRSISGIECSGNLNTSQAQYHVNGDIAHGFIKFYDATDDLDFMQYFGLEVLLNICLFFLEIGHFKDDKFYIHKVTGPNEYSPIANNNYYTNASAKFCFARTYKLINTLKESDVDAIQPLFDKCKFTYDDLENIKKASDEMYLPRDENLKICKQDDTFLDLQDLDFSGFEKPLTDHLHPLYLYRHQVLRRPDTLLALILFDDLENMETTKNSFEYYEKRTSYDSPIAYSAHGLLACRTAQIDKALSFFHKSINFDLDYSAQTTKDGVSILNLVGSILLARAGFGGVSIKEDYIKISPIFDKRIGHFNFNVMYKGSVINIDVKDSVTISLISGDSVKIELYNRGFMLKGSINVK